MASVMCGSRSCPAALWTPLRSVPALPDGLHMPRKPRIPRITYSAPWGMAWHLGLCMPARLPVHRACTGRNAQLQLQQAQQSIHIYAHEFLHRRAAVALPDCSGKALCPCRSSCKQMRRWAERCAALGSANRDWVRSSHVSGAIGAHIPTYPSAWADLVLH